jgi:hypothetical protein
MVMDDGRITMPRTLVSIICNSDLLRYYKKSKQLNFKYNDLEKLCIKKFSNCFGLKKSESTFEPDIFVTIFHNTAATRSLVHSLAKHGDVHLNLRFDKAGVGPLNEHMSKAIENLSEDYDGVIIVGINDKCVEAIKNLRIKRPNLRILVVATEEHTDELKKLSDSKFTALADRRTIFIDSMSLIDKIADYEAKKQEKIEALPKDSPELYYHQAKETRERLASELEAIIATEARWAYRYARDIIGGPWPEAELTIMNDVDYCWKYGKYILKLTKNCTSWKWDALKDSKLAVEEIF